MSGRIESQRYNIGIKITITAPSPQSSEPTGTFSLVGRLLRRMYSLCLARFLIIALRMTSEPALARPDLTPPNERRAPTLDRVRPPFGEPSPSEEACAAAARCAPSFAMTRERERRGLRAMSCFGLGGMTVGRGIFEGELAASAPLVPMIDVAAAVSDAWCAGVALGEDDAGLAKFVSGWLKILVGRGDSGLVAAAMVAFEEDAACVMLVRLGFCASATTGRPDVRPDADGRTAEVVLARELAVGA